MKGVPAVSSWRMRGAAVVVLRTVESADGTVSASELRAGRAARASGRS